MTNISGLEGEYAFARLIGYDGTQSEYEELRETVEDAGKEHGTALGLSAGSALFPFSTDETTLKYMQKGGDYGATAGETVAKKLAPIYAALSGPIDTEEEQLYAEELEELFPDESDSLEPDEK